MVKDYNKVLNFKNMTTGELFKSIDFDDDNFYLGMQDIFVKVSIGDLLLLKCVHDCIDEGHGCLVSVAYKNQVNS